MLQMIIATRAHQSRDLVLLETKIAGVLKANFSCPESSRIVARRARLREAPTTELEGTESTVCESI